MLTSKKLKLNAVVKNNVINILKMTTNFLSTIPNKITTNLTYKKVLIRKHR